jgi:tartrate dehydrogenase
MTKTLRGVCVGAGYFARFHREAWNRLEGVEIVAVVDLDEAKAKEAAEEFGIRQYGTDLEAILEECKPDFVDIATPPDTHLDLVRRVASTGTAILCQKALAPTFEEAKQIVETAQDAGVRFMVHENFRFQPWHRQIKKMLDERAIGKVHTFSFRSRMGDGWGDDAYLGRHPYFRDMPRLLVFENGVHYIDTYRYLGGEITGAYSVLRQMNPVIQGEDSGILIYEFASGAIGLWDANRYNECNDPDPRYTFGEFLVEGDGGSIRLYLDAALADVDVTLTRTSFPFGAGCYKETGKFMQDDALDQMRSFDAIFFGAVGLPDVDDRLPAKDFTFKVRCGFEQYVNYRPCRRIHGVQGPLRSDVPFDFVIVRENTEGEFILSGSEHHLDSPEGFATQMSVFTRKGTERVGRYAFKLAQTRGGKVTCVTKSNTLIHSLNYWDRVVAEVAKEFPDVELEMMYVDNASASMVLRPQHFDVILTTNMMGDILSDLGGALMGSLGLGPSGNINPERDFPSMFEPIHGSAPDIAGPGIANPVGAIESGVLMLEHLGETEAAARIRNAVETVLANGIHTVDLGGSATTDQMTDAAIEHMKEHCLIRLF